MVDAVVVVTRYSGGIKLGVGGLSRAYASAAKGESERVRERENERERERERLVGR